MNMILRATIAGALLSAASATAFATTVTPPGSATGITPTSDATNGSGLIVQVFDAATGHSLTEWLGPNFTGFLPAAQTPAGGETLDFGILGGSTAWTNFVNSEITSGGSLAALQFVVEAGKAVSGQFASLETTISANNNPSNSSVSTAVANKLSQVPAAFTNTAACNFANPCIALQSTDPGYLVNSMGPNGGGALGTTTTSGAIGTSLRFFLLAQNGSGLNASKPATQTPYSNGNNFATWTLGTNGDLVYNIAGTSAVPLPAGLWLLGSGLLGLAGIGRRNRAAA